MAEEPRELQENVFPFEAMRNMHLDATEESVRAALRDSDVELKRNEQEVIRFLVKVRQENTVRMKPASWRNIILVGRTRCGKSTAKEVLKHLWHQDKLASLYAGTQDATNEVFTMVDKRGEKEVNYNISIIDTPGLFEAAKEGVDGEARNNAVLMNTVIKCLEQEVREIHCVLFACSVKQGLVRQDVQSIQKFSRLFGDVLSSHCSILVTRCEDKTEEEKASIKAQMAEAAYGDLLKMVNNRVFFIGAIKHDDINNGHLELVRHQLENIKAMREEIFDYVFSVKNPFTLENLPLFKEKRAEINALIASLRNALDELNSAEGAAKEAKHQEVQKLRTKLDQLRVFVGTHNFKQFSEIMAAGEDK